MKNNILTAMRMWQQKQQRRQEVLRRMSETCHTFNTPLGEISLGKCRTDHEAHIRDWSFDTWDMMVEALPTALYDGSGEVIFRVDRRVKITPVRRDELRPIKEAGIPILFKYNMDFNFDVRDYNIEDGGDCYGDDTIDDGFWHDFDYDEQMDFSVVSIVKGDTKLTMSCYRDFRHDELSTTVFAVPHFDATGMGITQGIYCNADMRYAYFVVSWLSSSSIAADDEHADKFLGYPFFASLPCYSGK